MATTTIDGTAQRTNSDELKAMLERRHQALTLEVAARIRDARIARNADREVLDDGEDSEVDVQNDIEFALIQMKAETLNRIDEALRRLDEGTYGGCFDCGGEISQARLRALPFAVRCKDCEEALETAARRGRVRAQRDRPSGLFVDVTN